MNLNWERIVREHGPMVYGTAWRILGHAADCEDVVQEVFLQAHRTAQAEGVRYWPAFLRRLAAHRALDRLRQRKQAYSIDDFSLELPNGDPEGLAIERELAERLRQAIAQLSDREAAVFSLRFFEELSYQDIAQALDISPGAVAQALHKARTKLESLLVGVCDKQV